MPFWSHFAVVELLRCFGRCSRDRLQILKLVHLVPQVAWLLHLALLAVAWEQERGLSCLASLVLLHIVEQGRSDLWHSA